MSISAISTTATAALPQAKTAPDGDSAAVEQAESSATQNAEQLNGGFAPKAANPAPATPSATNAVTATAAPPNGGVNKVV